MQSSKYLSGYKYVYLPGRKDLSGYKGDADCDAYNISVQVELTKYR